MGENNLGMQSLDKEYKSLDKQAIEVEKTIVAEKQKFDKEIALLESEHKAAKKVDQKNEVRNFLVTIKKDFTSLVAETQKIMKESLQGRFVEVSHFLGNISINPNEIIFDAKDFCAKKFPRLGRGDFKYDAMILQLASNIAERASKYLEDFDSLYEKYAQQQVYFANVEFAHRKNVQKAERELK